MLALSRYISFGVCSAGFETYLAADAINKSVRAVNKSITASTENHNVTANVKVLIETVQKVSRPLRFSLSFSLCIVLVVCLQCFAPPPSLK